ncbi:MAG TPA: ElyC/SanA/YdcF family protein [Verrucomicrobiae bacterium]|nr:ElyC/SanA/YdcF family protein [Verrucomicrobiae bacterium]
MQSADPQNAAASKVDAPDKTICWGLLCRRSCPVPTLRGFVVFLVVFAIALVIGVRELHDFLAVNAPVEGGLLVVEGWTPDYGMKIVAEQFARDHYQKIYVTGGPIEYGSHLSQFKTYAQLGAATLVQLGMDSNVVQAVPAPKVKQDRTYAAAAALKKWFTAQGMNPDKIQLISDGPHSRRSRLLYEKALGRGVLVGVTAIPSEDYDEEHWWRYSGGVRNVIGEALAYLYARFIFSAPKSEP